MLAKKKVIKIINKFLILNMDKVFLKQPNLTPRKMPSPILINRLAKSNQVEANCRSYPISDLKKI